MKIQKYRWIALSRSILTVGVLLLSQTLIAKELVAEADRMVRQFAQESNAPGLSVSVGIADKIVWSQGYGYADLEQRVPVVSSVTKFRVGSVVKPMTALALVTLATQKRIDLDADVRRYAPLFPKKKHSFTVRQLAGHLAGIRHYKGNEAYGRKSYSNVSDALEIFNEDELTHKPGDKWRYSSYGYNLLSVVIENSAGKPFLNYLDDAVFTPLNMRSTVPDYLKVVIPYRGRYYVRENGQFFNEPEVDNSNKWASGGLLSTTDDLVKFGLAHMNDQIVSPAMRELLWTEQKTNSGEATGYGIGWRIVIDAEGNRWIGHGGGSIGGTSQLWLFPESELVISMASNLTELDYADILPRLRKHFLSIQLTEPRPNQQ